MGEDGHVYVLGTLSEGNMSLGEDLSVGPYASRSWDGNGCCRGNFVASLGEGGHWASVGVDAGMGYDTIAVGGNGLATIVGEDDPGGHLP